MLLVQATDSKIHIGRPMRYFPASGNDIAQNHTMALGEILTPAPQSSRGAKFQLRNPQKIRPNASFSNPFYPIEKPHALVAQLDRASDFDSEGREFESLRVRHFGTELDTPNLPFPARSGLAIRHPCLREIFASQLNYLTFQAGLNSHSRA
jgi:hypothetical protein